MENKKSQLDEVRCINKSGKVRFFRRYFAMDKNWQRATGFTPQELPPVMSLKKVEPEKEEKTDDLVPEFSIEFRPVEEEEAGTPEPKSPKQKTQTTAKANSQAAKQKEK